MSFPNHRTVLLPDASHFVQEDAPEEIDIVLIDHDDLPPYGAGEPSTRPVTAAIGNAIYDATGLRIRTAPFTPERIRTLIERGLAADIENASNQSV